MAENRSRKGFSLVEIAVALGLLAFVLLAIVGLLGVGLNSSKSAHIDTTKVAASRLVVSRVIAKIRNETNAGAYDSFSESTPYYFTFDGLEAPSMAEGYFECKVKALATTAGMKALAASNFKMVAVQVRYPVGATTNQTTNTIYASLIRSN